LEIFKDLKLTLNNRKATPFPTKRKRFISYATKILLIVNIYKQKIKKLPVAEWTFEIGVLALVNLPSLIVSSSSTQRTISWQFLPTR
jgi:hypothetical protein